ncbi:MAG TPA: hypothetical protein VHO25_24025 [Polyangiaceae bacterium]|nr:hypothetical protein [Polyangiaceae bacterium]
MTPLLRTLAACAVFLTATALLACGGQGAGSGASAADTTNSSDSSQESSGEDDSSDGEASSSSGSSASSTSRPVSARAACATGACTECGEGACPPGMFCVKSGGGAGCSWFPECGNNADCGCIDKHLASGCRCEKQGQFARVTCQ